MSGWDTGDQDDTPTTRTERLQRIPPGATADIPPAWTPRHRRARHLTLAATSVIVAGILLCGGAALALGRSDPIPAAEQPRPLPTPAAVTETVIQVVPGDPVTETDTVTDIRTVVRPTTVYVPTPSPTTVTETTTVTVTETVAPVTVTITETYTPPPEPTPEVTPSTPE